MGIGGSNVSRLVFFFQAEDGIRVLVRSRGLVDVYKRQLLAQEHNCQAGKTARSILQMCPVGGNVSQPVSYTHLTLPTISSV